MRRNAFVTPIVCYSSMTHPLFVLPHPVVRSATPIVYFLSHPIVCVPIVPNAHCFETPRCRFCHTHCIFLSHPIVCAVTPLACFTRCMLSHPWYVPPHPILCFSAPRFLLQYVSPIVCYATPSVCTATPVVCSATTIVPGMFLWHQLHVLPHPITCFVIPIVCSVAVERLEVTYSYWDGSGHRREIVLNKGITVGESQALGGFLSSLGDGVVGGFRRRWWCWWCWCWFLTMGVRCWCLCWW